MFYLVNMEVTFDCNSKLATRLQTAESDRRIQTEKAEKLAEQNAILTRQKSEQETRHKTELIRLKTALEAKHKTDLSRKKTTSASTSPGV